MNRPGFSRLGLLPRSLSLMNRLSRTLCARRPRAATITAGRASRRRLLLTALEDRSVPPLFTGTTLNDGPVTAAGDQPGTLRQAIFDANDETANPGTDTITFASG